MTKTTASQTPVSGSVRFVMMMIAVCLVYTGIVYGDPIYHFLLQLPLSSKIIEAIGNIGAFLKLSAQTMAGLTKAGVTTVYLLPVFTVGCILISQKNKYLKMGSIPFLSFSVGLLLKFLFGWRF